MHETLFLVLRHIDHEGFDILSTHRTVDSAVTEVGTLITPDSHVDGYSVLAVAAGQGRGITVARWIGEWFHDSWVDPEFEGPVAPFAGEQRWARRF